MNPRRNDSKFGGQRRRAPDPLEIWTRVNDPRLRICDVPGAASLVEQRMLDPDDPYVAELMQLVERRQIELAVASGDAFWGNAPPRGSLPPPVPGRIPICILPTGDVLSISLEDLCKNVLLAGPTGGGKTNSLKIIISSILETRRGIVVVFDRKGGEVVDAQHFARRGPLLILDWSELALAMLQPPPGISSTIWAANITELLGGVLDLQASRRLMLATLDWLDQRPRPPGQWPTIAEWIQTLDILKAFPSSRIGGYKEAALMALGSVCRELGQVINYASSDFFERLYQRRGAVIVSTAGLSSEAASLLSALHINYAFHVRASCDPATLEPLLFAMDDANVLLRGSAFSEAETGINPIAQWSFMGRSRRIGLIVAAQNFSLVSPSLRNNCDTVVCFGSYGRDCEEISRYWNLTPEQAAVLPTLRPGSCVACARSVHPLAVRGLVPEVK